LQAAPLPGQKYHVIIPVNTLKDDEVYAPNYPTGTKLALIRYPHAGTFEIPVLKVNNEHAPARKLLGPNVGDAIGINKNNADRLSGADFDGDTVMCIPTHDRGGKVHITATDPLKDLIGFDPQEAYKAHDTKTDANGNVHYYRNGSEYPIMKNKGMEMGVISNLITDMTLKGANPDEMARAVKHSMVVIDAEKHKLDYKASELENDIASLKRIYQKKDDGGYGGAGTIISRAKGQYSVEKRQGSYKVNVKGSKDYDPNLPEGAKLWKKADDLYAPEQVKYDKNTGMRTLRTADGKRVTYNVKNRDEYAKYNPVKKYDEDGNVYYTNRDGDIVYKTKTNKQKSTKMGETQDARTLLSTEPHPVELLYADYANDMKALGNKARLEMVNTPNLKQDREAKIKYAAEIKSLDDKLNLAMSNAPVNRAVLRKANAEIKAKKAANPDMSAEDEKKIGQQAIRRYRAELGALTRKDRNVDITDREWEAIQAGAISDSKLRDILNNTDLDKLRARATPKSNNSGLSDAQVSRLKAMSGTYTNAQLAEKFGISPSQVSKYLKGGN
jgi:DNA-binding CsgD family transcriptional regulator